MSRKSNQYIPLCLLYKPDAIFEMQEMEGCNTCSQRTEDFKCRPFNHYSRLSVHLKKMPCLSNQIFSSTLNYCLKVQSSRKVIIFNKSVAFLIPLNNTLHLQKHFHFHFLMHKARPDNSADKVKTRQQVKKEDDASFCSNMERRKAEE